jgi:Recombinase
MIRRQINRRCLFRSGRPCSGPSKFESVRRVNGVAKLDGHVRIHERLSLSRVAVLDFGAWSFSDVLRNRFYVGEVVFKGETLAGEQPAIVDQDLFDAVQAKLNEQINNHRVSQTKSEALLLGRIYDDHGHKMTPSHVRKRGIKYRYYISSALLQGQAEQAGAVSRIPADEIEAFVVKSVRDHFNESTDIENAPLIHNHVVRVEVQSDQLVIELANAKGAGPKRKRSRNVIEVSQGYRGSHSMRSTEWHRE